MNKKTRSHNLKHDLKQRLYDLGKLLRQLSPQSIQAVLFPENPRAYAIWQRRFLWRRLHLAISLALTAYLTFIVLRLFMAAAADWNWDASWLAMAGMSSLGLGICYLLLQTRFGVRHPQWIFLGTSWSITLVEQIWASLQGIAFAGVFSWTLAFLAQATLIPVRWHLHLVSQLGVLIYYIGINYFWGFSERNTGIWDDTLWLYLFWFCAICNLSIYLYERLQRMEFRARTELEAERAKSERLLLNILPESVAQQLKQEQRTIAEHFADASVLFADIVGFTRLSAGIPPEEMVTLLNTIFSEFDLLAERHGLEKIKTIGDAYMVVGGLPTEQPGHLDAIAQMSLDMQAAIATFNDQNAQNAQNTGQNYPAFQMRIGINTGPVVAGVIGVRKFIYDLWGDTVNIASRMESQSLPGCIQVTETVYQRLKSLYQFDPRGAIDIKGKGRMEVYILKSRL